MQKLWPLSGIAVILLSGFTMLRLRRSGSLAPEERARAAGFLLFLGSMASLALGLGVGQLQPRGSLRCSRCTCLVLRVLRM